MCANHQNLSYGDSIVATTKFTQNQRQKAAHVATYIGLENVCISRSLFKYHELNIICQFTE